MGRVANLKNARYDVLHFQSIAPILSGQHGEAVLSHVGRGLR